MATDCGHWSRMGQTQRLPLLEPPEKQPSLQAGLRAERRGFHFAPLPNQRLVPQVSHLSPMSNMTFCAEGRRFEMDAALKKAGHTVRLGEFETRPNWGPGVDTR